jgi:RNA polymerase sigma-70 factor, ECF subfamily
MRRYEKEIMRYLLRVLQDRDEAADLFQETWLRVYRAYSRLEPNREIRPWLYTIAANLCRNRFRDRARRTRVVVSDNEKLPAAETTGKDHGVERENEGYAAVRLRELISDLPIKQRQALHLRYFAGLDYGEIAIAMNCSEDSARAHVSQAVKKIKIKW